MCIQGNLFKSSFLFDTNINVVEFILHYSGAVGQATKSPGRLHGIKIF